MTILTNIRDFHHYLEEMIVEHTGWLNLPLENNTDLLNNVQRVATEMKMLPDVLLVIGVGGSFLGAKEIQEALRDLYKTINGEP